VTVASIAVIAFSTVDRLVVGALAGPRAVTQYAVPMNIVTRLWLLPASVTRALFPRLSHASEIDARALSRDAVGTLTVVVTPLVGVALVCIEPFLRVWIGGDLASRSAAIGEIALVGIFISSLAFVPYAQLQAQGRPDVPAKIALGQVVPYVCAIWLALQVGGVEGAAWVWAGRLVVESALLFAAARTPLGETRRFVTCTVLVLLTFVAVRAISSPLGVLAGGFVAAVTLVWTWRHGGQDVLAATRRELGRRGKVSTPEVSHYEPTPARTAQ
jgi:O-antigen/teichoic acid export membrane protein